MSMIRAMSRDMSKAMNRIMEVVCSAGTADAIGIDGTAGISGAVGIGRYALADRMTAYAADTHIMFKKNWGGCPNYGRIWNNDCKVSNPCYSACYSAWHKTADSISPRSRSRVTEQVILLFAAR